MSGNFPNRPRAQGSDLGENVIREGGKLVKTETPVFTAIEVAKPRNFERFVEKVKEEARLGGETMAYKIPFRTRTCPACGNKVDGAIPEKCPKCKEPLVTNAIGGSIALAQVMVRNYGNCTYLIDVDEEDSLHWQFKATFVDLESGAAMPRLFRQNKKNRGGTQSMKDERAEDMIFQIGQSKAIRNTVLRAMPKWLEEECIAIALDQTRAKISHDPKLAARKISQGLQKVGVPMNIILSILGVESLVKVELAHVDILLDLNSRWIATGEGETVSDLFPEIEEAKAAAEAAKPKTEAPKTEEKPKKAAAPKESAADLLDKMAGEEKPAGPSADDVDKAVLILQEQHGDDVLTRYEFAVPWAKVSSNEKKIERIKIIEGMIEEDAAKGRVAE